MKTYQEAIEVKANLIAGEEKIPIHARHASKYSLLVRFLNGHRFKDGAEFSKLVIQINGRNAELGPCRLTSEPNIDGYAGRLILTNDFYDLDSLFFDHKMVNLQTAFLNLPLVLGHKDKIRESFKEYTANLTYDLNVYKNFFDDLDSEYRKEPEDIKKLMQQTIIETEGRKFMRFLDDRLDELERMVVDFSKEEHERHGFYFRKQLWNIILCSEFMTRTNLKPRGYSGDSEMMGMIYSNDYRGESTFSKIINKHPLEHPAAQAVRNRRDLIAKMLHNQKENHSSTSHERLKVLSVACGPVFEMRDILSSPEDCQKYHFTLLDQDRHALLEAAQLIDKIEKSLDTKLTVDYLNASVRTMLATSKLKSKWGEFDFIYSMGLFDYLTPPVATAVLGRLYQLLKPGGQMVVGNFHVSNPSRYYMEYWLDWVIYYRTEEEFRNLLKDASSAEINVSYENTSIQMFLHIKKLG